MNCWPGRSYNTDVTTWVIYDLFVSFFFLGIITRKPLKVSIFKKSREPCTSRAFSCWVQSDSWESETSEGLDAGKSTSDAEVPICPAEVLLGSKRKRSSIWRNINWEYPRTEDKSSDCKRPVRIWVTLMKKQLRNIQVKF